MAAYLADPGNMAYHVSKAAVRMLTMCAAREFGPKKIRVNSVHYGPTMTGPMREALGSYVENGQFTDTGAALAGIEALSPLGITGTIEESGALVAFLASDEARFISGAAYWQDGGCFTQY
jgi:NAD(P)-dependent dehydrogenase (short-subunit alcohol dehydrogenase family)